jgi:TPR repeat protein
VVPQGQGYAKAQTNLGECYFLGVHGVATDYAVAADWYHKATEQGQLGAQLMLGVHYAFGLGVTRDEAVAVKWLRKSAEQDHPNTQEAQVLLWIMQDRVLIACAATIVIVLRPHTICNCDDD